MLEELFESEFFVLSHKINKVFEKKKFESFIKSLFGINSVIHHNLFVMDLIEGIMKFFGSSNAIKNMELNRNFVLIDQKNVVIKNIDYPFLGLPFQVKAIPDKFPVFGKINDITEGVGWNFKDPYREKNEIGLSVKKKKNKSSNGRIRFLIFSKMKRNSNFSTRKKNHVLALRNFI